MSKLTNFILKANHAATNISKVKTIIMRNCWDLSDIHISLETMKVAFIRVRF